MVQKLRHLLGRVEIRVLVLLIGGFLLAGLALAVAQRAKFEDYSNRLWLSVQEPAQGLTDRKIAVHIPAGFTNRVDIFVGTNLIDFVWTLAATNLVTEGTDTAYWTYDMLEKSGPVFVAAGNGGSIVTGMA